MRPAVGTRSPASASKNVLLPAPLGPIRPTISPSCTSRSAPSTARKRPKACTTPRASSSTRQPLAQVEQLQQPARSEARDQENDGAVNDIGDAGPRTAKC